MEFWIFTMLALSTGVIREANGIIKPSFGVTLDSAGIAHINDESFVYTFVIPFPDIQEGYMHNDTIECDYGDNVTSRLYENLCNDLETVVKELDADARNMTIHLQECIGNIKLIIPRHNVLTKAKRRFPLVLGPISATLDDIAEEKRMKN